MNDIDVIYTMWSNLKKTDEMEAGTVGFHKDKEVHKIRVAKRINEIVNRLNKTKREEKQPGITCSFVIQVIGFHWNFSF